MSGTSNWHTNGAGGLYGTTAVSGGGGGMLISVRDGIDAARLGIGSPRTPWAEYPDGYAGTQNSRRGDRLLDTIGKLNSRSYTRGVHVGSRVDPGDYIWPADWRPDRGIRSEVRGVRQSLASPSQAPELVYKGDPGRTAPPTDVRQVQNLSALLPAWR